MSAFFCDKRVIDDVVRQWLPRGSKADRTDLGRRLWRMNAYAVYQRYDHLPEMVAENEENLAEAAAYVYAEGSKDAYQRYKSVCCLTYQCSEGDVPETEFFGELLALERVLDGRLSADRPAYKAASWGYFDR